MADENVHITITADPSAALRAIEQVKRATEDLANRMPGGSVPPGGGAPSAPGLPPSQPTLPVTPPRIAPPPMPAVPPAIPVAPPRATPTIPLPVTPPRPSAPSAPVVPAGIPNARPSIWEAVKQAISLGGRGGGGSSSGGGAGADVRQMATSGQSVALMLFPNAAAGAEFLRAQGWSSSHLGTPAGVAQAGGMVGSTSAPGVAQARRTAQALRQAGASPLAAALSQNAGGAPVEPFANLLATSGALPGPAGNAIRAIAGRGTYGVASASDMQALQALKASTAGDLQAQVEALRGQRSTVAANLSGGRYRTAGAQAGARTQLGALDQKIGNLVAAMSTLDEATAAATAALAVTGATKPTGPSVGARASSVGRTLFGVAKRTASALGPIAGIASLGFVGASVGSYWQMANEAGRAWARGGQSGAFNPYFSSLQGMASASGFTIPVASSALSAASLYSGNTSGALSQTAGVLQMSRALGLDPQMAGQVLGQIASYGRLSRTYGITGPGVASSGPTGGGIASLNASLIGGRALASGLDPRQYLSALASVVGVAGQSNATVSAAGVSGLLSSAGTLANATGLSMFRGTRGASWLSKFQGATQQGLGGGAGEFITLQAIQSAYGATHGGHAAGNFHLMALQSAGPLGWHNRAMTSSYVNSLWHRFSPMGAAGESMMAKSLGMTNAEFYSLMHHGGIGAVTGALTSPVASASVSAAARHALGPAGGGAAGAAKAESAISGLTASIGAGLSPAVVGLTKAFKGLDNALVNSMGKKGAAWTILAGGALTGSGVAGAALTAGGAALLTLGKKLVGAAGAAGAGSSAAVGGAASLGLVGTMAAGAGLGLLLGGDSSAAVTRYNEARKIKQQYGASIAAASTATGVPAGLIESEILTESQGNLLAKNGSAHGLMQVVGGSFTPSKNIMQGSKILAAGLAKYHQNWAAATYYQSPLIMQDLAGIMSAHGLSVSGSSWQQAQPYVAAAVSQAARQNSVVAANQKQILQQVEAYPGNLQQSATAVYQANGLKVTIIVEPQPGDSGVNPA